MVLLYMVTSHQYTPNVTIYTSTMDPMGKVLEKPMFTVMALYQL